MSRPNLSYLKSLVLVAVGIPCGVLTGVTGLSPAPLLQPTLRWLIGSKGAVLNGVTLMVISFTAWSAMLSFGQSGDVQWFNGFMIAFGSFFGAAAAGKAIVKSPLFFVKIKPLWTFVPIALALLMIAQSTGFIIRQSPAPPLVPDQGILLPLLWSFAIGAVVGFIGFAGELGSMLTVPLVFFVLGRSILQTEGTALYVLLLASLPTAIIHGVRRTINTNAALSLSVGGLLGTLFGSHLAVKELPEATLIFVSGATLAVYALISLFQRPSTEASPKPEEP